MKKKIFAILVVLLLITATGCGQDSRISLAASRNKEKGYVHFSRKNCMFDMKIGEDTSDFYKFEVQNGVLFRHPENDTLVYVGIVDVNDPFNINNIEISDKEDIKNMPNKLENHINILLHSSSTTSLNELSRTYHSNIKDKDILNIKYNKTEKIGNYDVALFSVSETNHNFTLTKSKSGNGYLLKLKQGSYIYFISENDSVVREWIESIIEIDDSVYEEEASNGKASINKSIVHTGYYGANKYDLEIAYKYTSFKDLVANSYNVRFSLPFGIWGKNSFTPAVGMYDKYALFISIASSGKGKDEYNSLSLDQQLEDSKKSFEYGIIEHIDFPDKLYTFSTTFNYTSTKHVNVNGYDVIETTYEMVDQYNPNVKYYGVDCFYSLRGNYNDYKGIRTLHISAIDYSSTGENIDYLTKMVENIINLSEEDVTYEKVH